MQSYDGILVIVRWNQFKKRIRLRLADAFAHLDTVVISSHHLLFPRERPFFGARRSEDPFWHHEIAFSASSALVPSMPTQHKLPSLRLISTSVVMPDVISHVWFLYHVTASYYLVNIFSLLFTSYLLSWSLLSNDPFFFNLFLI